MVLTNEEDLLKNLVEYCDTDMEFPELIVFDCDMCLWSPEMYELRQVPDTPIFGDLNGRGKGVVGVKSGGEVVKLFPGALQALQEFADGNFPNSKIAAASSADNERAVACAHASMAQLEILPGLTMKELFNRGFEQNFDGNIQIGRSGKLSSNKTTHFREIQNATGIEYDKMVFFDDCNWGDNCAVVGRLGVVTQKTPNGLTYDEFTKCLKKYSNKQSD